MFLHQGLALLVLVIGADGSVTTDPELALAKARFAREFPDDAHGHTEIVLDQSATRRLFEAQS